MVRAFTACVATLCVAFTTHAAYDNESGTCSIVNPNDQSVVIGIYRPTANGIEERLVTVPAKSQIDKIPIPLTDDDQFAIAYRAEAIRDELKRGNPIKIYGHRRINIIRNKIDPTTPDVLIEFRGFNETFGDLRDQNRALYIPISEGEAKRVVRDANQKSTVGETPLARTEYPQK